jgi:hypothetical protein
MNDGRAGAAALRPAAGAIPFSCDGTMKPHDPKEPEMV